MSTYTWAGLDCVRRKESSLVCPQNLSLQRQPQCQSLDIYVEAGFTVSWVFFLLLTTFSLINPQ